MRISLFFYTYEHAVQVGNTPGNKVVELNPAIPAHSCQHEKVLC